MNLRPARQRLLRGTALAFGVAAVALGGCETRPPTAAMSAALELRYASPYSPSHPFSRADQAWMRFVEKRAQGRVRIRPLWAGALLSADQSMLELRHGVADIGLIAPIYARGGAHLIRMQSGFYGGVEAISDQVALYRCLAAGDPRFAAELRGLHVLAVQGGSLPGLVMRDYAVRTLADLRGLRLRVPTELLSVMRDLGADPVNMPMGEVYSAMAKGVLDGVVAPPDTLKSLHFAEIARYYTAIRIPRGAYPARAMSAERWRALPPEVRAVLDESTAVWERALEKEIRAALAQGEAFGREAGVEFIEISPEDQQAFDALYERDGLRNARSLAEFDIDAVGVFHRARALAAALREHGRIECG